MIKELILECYSLSISAYCRLLGKWAPVVTENLQAKGFRCQQLAIVCTKIVTVTAFPLLSFVIINKASKEQSLFAEL